MIQGLLSCALGAFCVAASLSLTVPGRSEPLSEVELITAAEASYPPNIPDEVRGPIPGPKIDVISPPEDVAQKSPIRLIIRFRTFGGAAVDTDSVRMIYEKKPLVELTPRIASYVTAAGIRLDRARVPPGTHVIRLQLKDTANRLSVAAFKFSVAP